MMKIEPMSVRNAHYATMAGLPSKDARLSYYGENVKSPKDADATKYVTGNPLFQPKSQGKGEPAWMHAYKKGGPVKRKFNLGGDVTGYVGNKMDDLFGTGNSIQKAMTPIGNAIGTAAPFLSMLLKEGGPVKKKKAKKSCGGKMAMGGVGKERLGMSKTSHPSKQRKSKG